jgi:hypothetical protein
VLSTKWPFCAYSHSLPTFQSPCHVPYSEEIESLLRFIYFVLVVAVVFSLSFAWPHIQYVLDVLCLPLFKMVAPSNQLPPATKATLGSAEIAPKWDSRYAGHVPHDASYYGKCIVGGILACGLTHTIICPLDVTKCNMQVSPRSTVHAQLRSDGDAVPLVLFSSV